MHIILANRWYPPHSGYGGVAMYNCYLAHALVKLGHRVTIVSSRSSPNIPAQADDDGIVIHRLLTQYRYRLHKLPLLGRYMRPLEQARYSVRVARKLIELERSDPFDVVEFADVNAEGWAYLRRRRRPVVVRCHTPTFVLRDYYRREEMPYDTKWTTRMEKATIRRADALTAPSSDMAQTIARHTGLTVRQISIIPNGLDVQLFNANGHVTESREVPKEELIVLHVGRLDRIKGIEVLAEAIPLVLENVPNIRFAFVGSGIKWRQRLEAFLNDCGIKEQVTFAGEVDQPTLLRWYQRADIAVVPTLNYESFSYACAQAMAAGLPLVASQIGGISQTIGNGAAAILVEPGQVHQLANALIELAQDLPRRRKMGQEGRARAETYFAASIVAQQMVDFYSTVIP